MSRRFPNLADTHELNVIGHNIVVQTVTRGDLVEQLVNEYRINGRNAAIALADQFIKQYNMSQLSIRSMFFDFRKAIGLNPYQPC